MPMLVMKFGGSSIGMTTGLTQLVEVVLRERARQDQLLLIVSALEGVTDALLDAAELARHNNRRGYRRIVSTLRTRHFALVSHLQLNALDQARLQSDIDGLLSEILGRCQTLAEGVNDAVQEEALTDAIAGIGERLAARIIAALLRHHQVLSVAVDGTDLIISNTVHNHATPDYERSRERCRTLLGPLLERQIVPIITGFIATGTHGMPTTLGRGGSDLTAAVVATSLHADEVWIWTNVDGLMTGDPHEVDGVRVLPEMSYAEAADLACFGARILHARMVAPLARQHIGLRLRNIYRPQVPGTLIHLDQAVGPALRSVTGTAALALTGAVNGPLHEEIRRIDDALYELTGSHIEAMLTAQSAESSVACFVIPISAGPEALHGLLRVAQSRLADSGGGPWQARTVGIVTVVGAMQHGQGSALAAALNALDGLHVLAASPNPSGVSVSIAVELADLPPALERLHALILRNELKVEG